MKRLQSILCASLLTLSFCSSAFAGLIPGKTTPTSTDRTSAGLMPGGKSGLISGIATTVVLEILLP